MNLHKNIRLLTWFNFFSDFRPYAPIAILYFSNITGSYAIGLSIFSIEMISASIGEVPTGIISDMVGRKQTIIFGAIMSVLSLIFYAIGAHFYILVLGSICAGIARSFFSGNNQAFLHDTLKEFNQEQAYAEHAGKVASMFQFALAISALIGGIVAYFSFSILMWISLIPQVICFLISIQMKEPKIHNMSDESNIYSHLNEAVQNFRNNSKLRTLSIASILEYGIGETIYQFNSAFVSLLWPVWAIGISKMLSNIFAATGMRLSGRITKKLGPIRSLIFSNMYSRCVGLFAVIFPSIFSPILISSTSFPFGISLVAKDTLFQKEFANKQRATMGSLNSLGGSLFFAFFAFLFGFIADKLAPNQALIIGELLLFIVLFLYYKLFASEKYG
ncbi:MAG: MFS transporter [Candidatus Roizmanbacteria bacterium]